MAGDGAGDALAAVAHALENLTREGESFATGRHDRFPPPGLRLNGDKHELQQPLAPAHEQAIIRRASGSRARGRGKPTTWELTSDQVEILNPKWDAFVDEIVDEIREPMGIALDASITATLSKAVLHTQGGRFDEPSDDDESPKKKKKTKRAFATLVVVLPGDFQGGDFVLPQRGQQPVPGPCFVYDVAYVAFYHDSAYKSNPVTSGARLSLVYELSTKTITDVPQSAGATLLQGDVDAALAQYFGLTAKRQKNGRGQEATSTDEKNERFVYVVNSGGTFEGLKGSDHDVAESLAAFCRSTQGTFALYLADLQCKRVTCRDNEDDDDAFDSDDENAEITLYLESPWLPYLDSDDYVGPTIELSNEDVVAPDELWERLKEEEWEIEHIGYHEPSEKTQWHRSHALVVQASSSSAPGQKAPTTKKRKAA